jgi:hypothetical protein
MMQRNASALSRLPDCSMHSVDSYHLNAKAFGWVGTRPEGTIAAS